MVLLISDDWEVLSLVKRGEREFISNCLWFTKYLYDCCNYQVFYSRNVLLNLCGHWQDWKWWIMTLPPARLTRVIPLIYSLSFPWLSLPFKQVSNCCISPMIEKSVFGSLFMHAGMGDWVGIWLIKMRELSYILYACIHMIEWMHIFYYVLLLLRCWEMDLQIDCHEMSHSSPPSSWTV